MRPCIIWSPLPISLITSLNKNDLRLLYIYYVPSNGSICDPPSNDRATHIIEKKKTVI